MENPVLNVNESLSGQLYKEGHEKMSRNHRFNGQHSGYDYSAERAHMEIEYLKDRTAKTEDAIDKLVDVSNNVSRLLAVHDEKIKRNDDLIIQFDNKLTNLSKDMKERDKEITDHINDKMATSKIERDEKFDTLTKVVEKLSETLGKFVKYGWMAAGGFFVLTIIFPNFEVFKKILALLMKL